MTMRNSAGALLGRLVVGKALRYGYPQMMLSRAAVHEALLAEVPDGTIGWGKKVTAVRETAAGVEVEFEDGLVETADLVIGADGVWSRVREAVVGREYPVHYEGLCGIGGFLPLSTLPHDLRASLGAEPVTMTFGSRGFFGYAPCVPLPPFSPSSRTDEPGQIMWWSTYEVDPPPSRRLPLKDVRSQLFERHGAWASPHDSASGDPVFSSIIELACGSDPDTRATTSDRSLLVLPSHTTPRLPHWGTPSGRVLLLGDACHAMPPHSGQGVSCAVEDSLAIALLLEHFLAQRPTSPTTGDLDLASVLKHTAKAYEEIRMPRVGSILDRARRIGNSKRTKGPVQEWIRDWVMWFFCKLPDFIMHDRLYGYNVETEVTKYLGSIHEAAR
jgi:2-polyprenyl-6-methoxyphenol hydroxylase-like FAD-dependent oxidoreductase